MYCVNLRRLDELFEENAIESPSDFIITEPKEQNDDDSEEDNLIPHGNTEEDKESGSSVRQSIKYTRVKVGDGPAVPPTYEGGPPLFQGGVRSSGAYAEAAAAALPYQGAVPLPRYYPHPIPIIPGKLYYSLLWLILDR